MKELPPAKLGVRGTRQVWEGEHLHLIQTPSSTTDWRFKLFCPAASTHSVPTHLLMFMRVRMRHVRKVKCIAQMGTNPNSPIDAISGFSYSDFFSSSQKSERHHHIPQHQAAILTQFEAKKPPSQLQIRTSLYHESFL